MTKTAEATYDFANDFATDAAGLATFIDEQYEVDRRAVGVYVVDQDGAPATKAVWEKETLTDGSVVFNLVIHFDRA